MKPKRWHQYYWPEDVPYTLDYPRIPLQRILEDAAREWPHAPFLLFDDTVLSFRQVDQAANQAAHFLIAQGIQPGDRVALVLPNLPHLPVILFGALKAGATVVLCNPTLTADELRLTLQDAGVRGLFVLDHPKIYPTACEALTGTAVETIVYCSIGQYLPLLKRALGGLLGKIPQAQQHEPGHIALAAALAGRPVGAPPLPPQPDAIALIQYTGGTTGTPKGACLTHFNLVANLYNAAEWVRPGEDRAHARKMVTGGECFMGLLPWFHAYGLVMTLLAALYLRSRVVCVPDPYAGTPPFTEILRLVQKHRATVLNGVPTLFSALLHHPLIDQFDLTSLKLCGCGAAPLPVEVARQFEARTGAILYEAYGLTETATMTHCNPTNRAERRLGTLGLPVLGTDALIVDIETGLRELPQGEDGEIAIHGPQVMPGYWNRPDENAAVFREINGQRYLLTGDIGHMDAEGFFVLSARKKEIIITGGYKIYPPQVEDVLHTHPKIAQAAVVGAAHPRMGEVVKAFIVLKAGQQADKREIIQFCKQHMVGYKVPRLIEFRDKLPMLPTGKVNKRQLAQTATAAALETE
jgi:long-chain acyl-CoA synthetase